MTVSDRVILSSRWSSLFGALGVFLLAAVMCGAAVSIENWDLLIIGSVCLVLFGIYGLLKAFRPKRLIVSTKGFVVRPVIGKSGQIIPWSAVDRFEIYSHPLRHSTLMQTWEVSYFLKGSAWAMNRACLGSGWSVPAHELLHYMEDCRSRAVGHDTEETAIFMAKPMSALTAGGYAAMVLAGTVAIAFLYPFLPARRGSGPMLSWDSLEPRTIWALTIIWGVCLIIGLTGMAMTVLGKR